MTHPGDGAAIHHCPPQARWLVVRLLAAAILVVVCVVAAELGARVFWRARAHIPLRHPSRALYISYPDLAWVDGTHPMRGDGRYNILLLGGSTLHQDWGPVAAALAEDMAYHGQRNVRIYDLAYPAHTSRDSRLKYAALEQARFDLVIVYDGINDTRANNVPPALFQEDYGHITWYQVANALATYHRKASFALPYTARYVGLRISQVLHPGRYIRSATPSPAWVEYGRDPRSVVSFTHNLEVILALARRRGDRVMLMTFAMHVPRNYSLERFELKTLDYGLHYKPIEDWGRQEYVEQAVAAQNEAIRALAAQHREVLFVDQARLVGGTARYFNDSCHLTVMGAARFVENIVATIPEAAGR